MFLYEVRYNYFIVRSGLPLLARINEIQVKHLLLSNLIYEHFNESYYIPVPFIHDNTKAVHGLYK